MLRITASILCLSTLSGCATILAGTTQDIMVNTNPPAANCALNREGQLLGNIANTPGSLKVEKTKHDMTILCKKEGYQDATYLNKSGLQPATWGNIVLGGLIGWGVDSALGADNKYDSPVNLSLVPQLTNAAPAVPGVGIDASMVPASLVPAAPTTSPTVTTPAIAPMTANPTPPTSAPSAAPASSSGSLGVLKPVEAGAKNIITAPASNASVTFAPTVQPTTPPNTQSESNFFQIPPDTLK